MSSGSTTPKNAVVPLIYPRSGRWVLGINTTAERTRSRWHDVRRDRQVRIGVEGVRAHPGVDSEGGGRSLQRRARRRDTDSHCAARATAVCAPEGHRSMSRHGLGAASALDKGYSPECVEGVFCELRTNG